MTTPRPRSRFLPGDLRPFVFAVGLIASLLAGGAAARAQDTCNPACGPGQLCYQGICMVPAPAATPPAATPAAPNGPTAAEPGAAAAAPLPPAGASPGSEGPPSSAGGAPPQPPLPQPPPNGYGYPPPPPPYGPPRPPAGAPPAASYYPPPPPSYPPRSYGYQPGAYRRSYGYPPRRLFLATPYVGISSFLGTTADIGHRAVGARGGAILGFRVHPAFSLNGEISVDALNFRDVPSGQKMDGGAFALSASPLFHLFAPRVELVFGPRLGVWGEGITRKVNDVQTRFSASGFLMGLNGGLFFPVRRCLSVGGLVTLDSRLFGRTCTKNDNGSEACSENDLPKALTNLTLDFALMF